jgi:NAD(P)-dependent dehydrogenase (short-subunit alcohol dehydrogenase family)
MGLATTAGSVAIILGASTLYLLRRRISKNWIRYENKEDLSGKLVVITGGNVGLGYETAKDLAGRHARVIMGCRNVQKGQEAVEAIQVATGNDAVECLELDLSSLSSVRMFCSEVKSKYPPIDILILNAGVWVPMDLHQTTSDGFEIHFGVNHLAHFEMARLLESHMAKPSSRIVFVASSLAKSGKIDFDGLDFVREGRVPEKPSFAPTGYCDSKLMNAFTCRQLATTLPSHVTTYAVCPGFCRSSLGRNVTFPLYKKVMMAPFMLLLQRSAVQGAQNIVFASIEDKDNLTSGGFYRDGEIQQELSDYIDSLGSDAPEQLWRLSDKLATET